MEKMSDNIRLSMGIMANLSHSCTAESAIISIEAANASFRLAHEANDGAEAEALLLWGREAAIKCHCNLYVRGKTKVVPRLHPEILQHMQEWPFLLSQNVKTLLAGLQA